MSKAWNEDESGDNDSWTTTDDEDFEEADNPNSTQRSHHVQPPPQGQTATRPWGGGNPPVMSGVGGGGGGGGGGSSAHVRLAKAFIAHGAHSQAVNASDDASLRAAHIPLGTRRHIAGSGKTLASFAAGCGSAPLDKYDECFNAWAVCNSNVSAQEIQSETDEWLKSKGMPLGLRVRMRPDVSAGAPTKIRDFLAAARTQIAEPTRMFDLHKAEGELRAAGVPIGARKWMLRGGVGIGRVGGFDVGSTGGSAGVGGGVRSGGEGSEELVSKLKASQAAVEASNARAVLAEGEVKQLRLKIVSLEADAKATNGKVSGLEKEIAKAVEEGKSLAAALDKASKEGQSLASKLEVEKRERIAVEKALADMTRKEAEAQSMLASAVAQAKAREEALERGHAARGAGFAKGRSIAAVRGALRGWRGFKERAKRVEKGWFECRRGLVMAAFVEWEHQTFVEAGLQHREALLLEKVETASYLSRVANQISTSVQSMEPREDDARTRQLLHSIIRMLRTPPSLRSSPRTGKMPKQQSAAHDSTPTHRQKHHHHSAAASLGFTPPPSGAAPSLPPGAATSPLPSRTPPPSASTPLPMTPFTGGNSTPFTATKLGGVQTPLASTGIGAQTPFAGALQTPFAGGFAQSASNASPMSNLGGGGGLGLASMAMSSITPAAETPLNARNGNPAAAATAKAGGGASGVGEGPSPLKSPGYSRLGSGTPGGRRGQIAEDAVFKMLEDRNMCVGVGSTVVTST